MKQSQKMCKNNKIRTKIRQILQLQLNLIVQNVIEYKVIEHDIVIYVKNACINSITIGNNKNINIYSFWIGSCVGELNHRRFMALIFFQSWTSIKYVTLFWNASYNYAHDSELLHEYLVCLFFGLISFVFSCFTVLFYFIFFIRVYQFYIILSSFAQIKLPGNIVKEKESHIYSNILKATILSIKGSLIISNQYFATKINLKIGNSHPLKKQMSVF